MASLRQKEDSFGEKGDLEVAGVDSVGSREHDGQMNDLHRGLEARHISMIALVGLIAHSGVALGLLTRYPCSGWRYVGFRVAWKVVRR